VVKSITDYKPFSQAQNSKLDPKIIRSTNLLNATTPCTDMASTEGREFIGMVPTTPQLPSTEYTCIRCKLLVQTSVVHVL